MSNNYLFFLLFIFCLGGCELQDVSDCFKKQGDKITLEVELDGFSKISISKGIELFIKQAEKQEIKVKTGENFIKDIKFEIIDNELRITDKNACEMLRNYHATQVFIETPVLEKVYSASQYSVHSKGVLTFPNLILESGLHEDTPSSVFEMEIENESLKINNNVSSVFKIKGQTHHLEINFWSSNGRFEGDSLMAQKVSIFHRSSNDMFVFPIQEIKGTIAGTGNLVLKNVPPVIEVEQLYSGHIVYP